MRWADVDLEAAEWRFILSKTKQPHIVPLSKQTGDILKDLYPITGSGLFVFPFARTGSRPMSNMACLVALRSMGITQNEMTNHGWRATARTLLEEVLGYAPHIVEQQLGHVVRDPNGRAYNRTTNLETRRAMMQDWSDYTSGLKGDLIS
jgi:integrase